MKTIKRMYDHLSWANKRILGALDNEDNHHEAIRLFAHILLAEQVWLTRLQGKDSSHLRIWSDGDQQTCIDLVKKNEKRFTILLDELDDTSMDKLISYSNSKGVAFQNSIRDILTHIALHGQYHRGQINSMLRAKDTEPVNTDFITFVR